MNFDLNYLFHWLTPVTFVSPLKNGKFPGLFILNILYLTAVVVVVELVVKFIMA
jgi:polyferredoxin